MPPSLFLFFFFSFSFIFYFFGGLIGSFYLTLICPLCDLFLTLGAILYILQEYRRSFTLYKGYLHKEDVTIMMQMYASASVAGYAMILGRHVAIIRARPNYHAAHRSSKSMYDRKIKS